MATEAPTWIALLGPREIVDFDGAAVDLDGDVRIPLGTEGLRGLIASAIEHGHALKTLLDREQWSRELALAITNLEQAALWLLADELNDTQAWPGGLTDSLLRI